MGGRVRVCVCENLLGQGLLQRSQRRVRVGRVRLQRLDSVFQAAQLLVFVPQLVLQVLDLHGRAVVTHRPHLYREKTGAQRRSCSSKSLGAGEVVKDALMDVFEGKNKNRQS